MKTQLISVSLIAAALSFSACGDKNSSKAEASRYRAACESQCADRVACGVSSSMSECKDSCEGEAFVWSFVLDYYAMSGGGKACRNAMRDFVDCLNAMTYTCTPEGTYEPDELPANCEGVDTQLELHCDFD